MAIVKEFHKLDKDIDVIHQKQTKAFYIADKSKKMLQINTIPDSQMSVPLDQIRCSQTILFDEPGMKKVSELINSIIGESAPSAKDIIDRCETQKDVIDGDSFPLQRILYGAPGTGKSYSVFSAIAIHLGIINEKEKLSDAQRKGLENANYIFRTTFHPDYDYAQFVGCYKPTKDDEGKITYEFTPQVFINALVKAYESTDPVYLVIEEINRGNCAQIFGDIFQLLDRNGDGDSEYSISVDEDLKKYLEEKCPKALSNGKIKLPRNFNIIATMNTSDQSLFPMDSAFKRRWEWEYVPVDLSDEVDSSKFEITIDGSKYKWHDFLRAVNVKIKDVTKSEDKQMGNFFIKKSVDAKEFCNKVMFYLWNDISKDYYESNDSLFQYKTGDGTKHFSFNELFGTKQFELLKGFMSFVGCEVSNSAKPEETTVSEEPQKEEDNN